MRSNDIRVEAHVDVNCSITNDTIYEWTVTNTDSGLRIYHLEPFMLHDPLLILPKMILSNGNYSVQLRVRKQFLLALYNCGTAQVSEYVLNCLFFERVVIFFIAVQVVVLHFKI